MGTACFFMFKILLLKICPAFLDFFTLQNWLPRDFVSPCPKKAKVCLPDAWSSSSAGAHPYFVQKWELYQFHAPCAPNGHHAHTSPTTSPSLLTNNRCIGTAPLVGWEGIHLAPQAGTCLPFPCLLGPLLPVGRASSTSWDAVCWHACLSLGKERETQKD